MQNPGAHVLIKGNGVVRLKLIIFLTFYMTLAFGAKDKVCEEWFKSLKIVTQSGCESYCSIAKTDLRTFVCKSKCDKLCSELIPINQSLSILNPVLNKSEQDLAKKFPINCLMAYKLSFDGESLCSEIFLKSLNDDESDACRHFIWTYLMAQRINSGFAKKVLTAHENEPYQPKISKEMDELNNDLALKYFKKMPKLDEVNLKKLFLNELNAGKLKINNPNPKNWRKSNEIY